MPTDQNIRSASGSEHQPLVPPPRHKGVRAIVWILVLLVFAGGFYLVLRKRDASASAAKSPRGGGGAVNLVSATAKQGDIGVYLDSIGTVTPVYTASITSQVNGIVTAVHYKEGQLVRKGDSLIDIDARPYQASLLQAQGTLERDTHLLAQTKMDLQRYHEAWDRNAIPKQTLDDQEKLVLQQQGTLKFDEGVVSSTRSRSTIATSSRPSPAESVCASSIQATSCSLPEISRSQSSPKSSPSP